MSDHGELAASVRETLAAVAARDPRLVRFGAAAHRYELAPPLDGPQVQALETTLGVALPADLRAFVTAVGSGGAGPAYGWIPVARAAAAVVTGPATQTAWTRALPIAHLGCGYAAVIALDGEARGTAWIDARVIGLVAPIDGSFTGLYIDWLERLARAAWPEQVVPPGVCALASALSGYLGVCEQQRGLPAGGLTGAALRAVLGDLPPSAIEIAAEASALYAPGERVDPCLTCARLLDALTADGLGRDVVAPGLPPRPLR